ncbi:Transmembrane domain-containing protein [Spironucleus salmonicida]|uniref:Transmembrane domain-containing protein n=1 Tax=Spironucleus salmonicida TaxID=348837 RepID=A0A9P8LP03_9EUKA|nr:Transmembrane domain-containing protein [Spironucleus salmonicida]
MLSVLRTKKYKMNSCNFSISLQALVWNQQYTILLNYHALLVNIGVSQKYISSSAMHDPTHPYRQWIQQVPSSADVASLQQNSSQRVVVTIQNSSIPRLRSQAAYRVRLQSIIFDRLCIIRVLKIQYNQSSAQPVLALLVRIAFLVYFVPGLISEYVLVSIVAYYISTIVYAKYPYKHHSQCIYTTKLQLRYSYIYYSIVLSSSTIPVPLTPALVLSMELLGVPYWWYPLHQQAGTTHRIYKQSSAQPVLVLYR